MGGGLTFVYDITGSCNCGCEWQGTRPIADRSCIKFDVTKYTIASDVWRQPPSFSILLTHACFLVCHIYLLFLSALLIFPPSADVVFSHHTCLMQRNGLRGCLLLKQVMSMSRGSSRFFLLCCNKMFHWDFLVLKLRMRTKILGFSWWRASWCRHAWRFGALALVLWVHQQPFKFLKKCKQ